MLLARGSAMWPALLLVAASCHGVSAFLPAAPAARSPMAHLDARRAGVAQRRGRTPLTMVQTPPRQSVSIKELSKQMQSARLDMEQGEVDERVRVLMEGMRGKSLNDDDFAAAGTEMRVIEFDSKNDLPLQYDPDLLKTYYKARPGLWLRRLLQVCAPEEKKPSGAGGSATARAECGCECGCGCRCRCRCGCGCGCGGAGGKQAVLTIDYDRIR